MNTGYNFSNAKSYLIPQKIIVKQQSNNSITNSKLTKTLSTDKNGSSMNNNHFKPHVEQRKFYAKINEERYKRLTIVIEKFKQLNSSKHLTGIDKSRYSGKENIFSSLVRN